MHFIRIDFRSKLLVIMLTMSLVAMLISDIAAYMALAVLFVYLCIQRYIKCAFMYSALSLLFAGLRFISGGAGLTFLMPEMFLFMATRFFMMMMAAAPVMGMPPGEITAVMKKMHAPDFLALPLIFMIRFIDAVKNEFRDVYAMLRIRGLISLSHPLLTVEYMITPVIFNSSRIAEELAASAESRGISFEGRHTCIREIRFRRADVIVSVLSVMCSMVLMIVDRAAANG